ncbi:unnamed protein product [Orchesella dallaii]|uniref:Uncharacterized protein n=1 Tax=Orchesella dallaii TaxID=48710 RepID=A0ABP1PSA3_9HEXA
MAYKTAEPFFGIDKHTFPQFIQQGLDFLISLLMIYSSTPTITIVVNIPPYLDKTRGFNQAFLSLWVITSGIQLLLRNEHVD